MLKYPFLFIVKFYQLCLSPVLGSNCRFTPSCSTYTYQAIKKYGGIKGSYLGIKRIIKCGPWHPGGDDPLI
jgi:uncharacterized protein